MITFTKNSELPTNTLGFIDDWKKRGTETGGSQTVTKVVLTIGDIDNQNLTGIARVYNNFGYPDEIMPVVNYKIEENGSDEADAVTAGLMSFTENTDIEPDNSFFYNYYKAHGSSLGGDKIISKAILISGYITNSNITGIARIYDYNGDVASDIAIANYRYVSGYTACENEVNICINPALTFDSKTEQVVASDSIVLSNPLVEEEVKNALEAITNNPDMKTTLTDALSGTYNLCSISEICLDATTYQSVPIESIVLSNPLIEDEVINAFTTILDDSDNKAVLVSAVENNSDFVSALQYSTPIHNAFENYFKSMNKFCKLSETCMSNTTISGQGSICISESPTINEITSVIMNSNVQKLIQNPAVSGLICNTIVGSAPVTKNITDVVSSPQLASIEQEYTINKSSTAKIVSSKIDTSFIPVTDKSTNQNATMIITNGLSLQNPVAFNADDAIGIISANPGAAFESSARILAYTASTGYAPVVKKTISITSDDGTTVIQNFNPLINTLDLSALKISSIEALLKMSTDNKDSITNFISTTIAINPDKTIIIEGVNLHSINKVDLGKTIKLSSSSESASTNELAGWYYPVTIMGWVLVAIETAIISVMACKFYSKGDNQAKHLPVTTLGTEHPIGIALSEKDIELITYDNSSVTFDYSGTGAVKTSWVGSSDAILVYDFNKNGNVESSKNFVMTAWHTESNTDFLALLGAFDSNGDNIFDAQDVEFVNFALWQDANSNGVSEAGEMKSLQEIGIRNIDFTTMQASQSNAEEELGIIGTAKVNWEDGRQTLAYDLIFTHDTVDPLLIQSVSGAEL